MQSVAFAIRLLPGQTDANRVGLASCWVGARKEAYQDARRRAGIIREAVWIQPAPAGDVALVYVEADDLETAFTMLATSPESFDRSFRDHVRQVHGATWGHAFTVPELVLDFDINSTGSSCPPPSCTSRRNRRLYASRTNTRQTRLN